MGEFFSGNLFYSGDKIHLFTMTMITAATHINLTIKTIRINLRHNFVLQGQLNSQTRHQKFKVSTLNKHKPKMYFIYLLFALNIFFSNDDAEF
jgi:hypothetical protein